MEQLEREMEKAAADVRRDLAAAVRVLELDVAAGLWVCCVRGAADAVGV